MTHHRRPDRRVNRTRRALKEALTDLILEKGYEHVTVGDVLDRADVGRSTFYAHFVDKDALLMAILADLDVPGSGLQRLDPGRPRVRLDPGAVPAPRQRQAAVQGRREQPEQRARSRGDDRATGGPRRGGAVAAQGGAQARSVPAPDDDPVPGAGRSSASWTGGCARRTTSCRRRWWTTPSARWSCPACRNVLELEHRAAQVALRVARHPRSGAARHRGRAKNCQL